MRPAAKSVGANVVPASINGGASKGAGPAQDRKGFLEKIKQGWDELLPLVAAIRDGRLTTREALERLGSAAKGERLFAAADVRSATSRSRLSRTDRTLAAASPKASAMSTAVPATDVIRA